ncbi:ABC transporter substrate-binding protein [Chelativorans sp. ZYF759]|nr:ABC transporter substrate-binding protein [Chelativorans sp. ZYF759]
MVWRSVFICPLVCLLGLFPAVAMAEGTNGFPLTIEHAFGTTVIDKKPTRPATVAWANHEVPLALGVVPVGFARANFGDDDGNGLLPWVEDRLAELGAEPPILFDEGDGIDFEAVAASEPDVILAAYSGISRSDYETLSQIAPVVAYVGTPWSTDWREMIRLNSAGLGMVAEGEDLIDRLENEIAARVADHPELSGKSAMFLTHLNAFDLGTINFYTINDTRVKFFQDLGLGNPASVATAGEDGRFAASISAERIDEFDDVDIVVTYGDDQLLDAVRSNPLISRMPAIADGALVVLGRNPLGTAANPTPLSIPYVLDAYVDMLAKAAGKRE